MKKLCLYLAIVVGVGLLLVFVLNDNKKPTPPLSSMAGQTDYNGINQPPAILVKETKFSKREETIAPPIDDLNLAAVSVQERQQYYNGLLDQSPLEIFKQLIAILNSDIPYDPIRIELISSALEYQLQHTLQNEQVYQLFYEYLNSQDGTDAQKEQLITILERTSTPESVDVLLTSANGSPDSNINSRIRSALAKTADYRWDGRFHEELSSRLEQAWASTENESFHPSIATAIAKVGSPNGVRLLLDELLASNGSYDEIKISDNPKAQAALRSLGNVRNPEAVPVLSELLKEQNSTTSNATTIISGNTLAAMGRPEATQALLEWSVVAQDDQAIWAKRWFSKVRDPGSIEIMQQYIDNNQFISTRVKDEVIRVYNKKASGR